MPDYLSKEYNQTLSATTNKFNSSNNNFYKTQS